MSRFPPTLRLPLAAGLIVFIVAVVSTQVALRIAGSEADQQIARLGEVYLDGLATAVRPILIAGDLDRFDDRFDTMVAEHQGIRERALFAFDTSGRLVVRGGDPGLSAETATEHIDVAFAIDEALGVAWVSRPLLAGAPYRLVAGLDITEIIESRRRLLLGVVGIDLIVAAAFGLLAAGVLSHMSRPMAALIDELEAASRRPPAPIPQEKLAGIDDRTRPLFDAFNRMVAAGREREALMAQLAEREQAAALGRLAATIAHEIRSPLGGLATAVSTLKRFGADAEVRAESLGFLERGIAALDGIVTSTLNIYRPQDERRLTGVDFEDLERLVRPAAAKGGVCLVWSLELPDTISVGAVGVRQVLLNLLLNACAATPPGGRVSVTAQADATSLTCTVTDEGPGMAAAPAARLSDGLPAMPGSRRLGMDVVVGLLGSLKGYASVAGEPGGGTTIRVVIPLEPAA